MSSCPPRPPWGSRLLFSNFTATARDTPGHSIRAHEDRTGGRSCVTQHVYYGQLFNAGCVLGGTGNNKMDDAACQWSPVGTSHRLMDSCSNRSKRSGEPFRNLCGLPTSRIFQGVLCPLCFFLHLPHPRICRALTTYVCTSVHASAVLHCCSLNGPQRTLCCLLEKLMGST